MSLFNTEDNRAEQTLTAIQQLLQDQLAVLNRIMEKVMSTSPVSQATFDTALAQYANNFNTLLTALQSIETGLSAVEASLTAAQQSSGSDFTGELATVQNLQAEAQNATTQAQASISGLPAADQPTPTPTPTPTPQAQVRK